MIGWSLRPRKVDRQVSFTLKDMSNFVQHMLKINTGQKKIMSVPQEQLVPSSVWSQEIKRFSPVSHICWYWALFYRRITNDHSSNTTLSHHRMSEWWKHERWQTLWKPVLGKNAFLNVLVKIFNAVWTREEFHLSQLLNFYNLYSRSCVTWYMTF